MNRGKKQVATLNRKRTRWLVCLTDAHVLLTEEGVHVVDICHELAVAEGEISHVPARLGSCQHLQQRWEGRKRRLDSESAKKQKKQKHKILSDTQIFFFLWQAFRSCMECLWIFFGSVKSKSTYDNKQEFRLEGENLSKCSDTLAGLTGI